MSDVLSRLRSTVADRYRLERELGQGGMATVYLAHDLRHDRDVAIKVLHPELGAALGGDRFLGEIKTTARLQHPHILPLLDSGGADGLLYYVMPYVAGETLRARLARERQLPVEDALRVAREVADALNAAHSLGIIHRDIKPENILLQGGHALVADFGIALAVQAAGGARMTQTGLSLGTPQYMSPEQAMGEKVIDARSDVYALGAVTYEMLTGEPPFTGPTIQAIVARVMTEEPRPIHGQRKSVPAGAEAAVMRALEKLPADRFATAAEFQRALDTDLHARRLVERQTLAPRRPWRLALAMLGVAVLATGGGWTLGRLTSPTTRATGATRFTLETRPGERTPVIIGKLFAPAPDGSSLVYVATVNGQTQQLYRRRFDELDATPIAGTTGASDPVFSPDGKWIAFITGAQLVKVPVEGGTPFRLAPVSGSASRGVAWSSNGEIVFATNGATTLFAVPQDGGPVRTVFRSPTVAGLRWPVAIPGSNRILYSTFSPAGDSVQVWVGSLTDGTATAVDETSFAVIGFLEGKLISLTRAGDIMATPFDLHRGVTTGTSLRVGSGVQMSTGIGFGIAALSSTGDLVYRDGATASQLLYADRAGITRPAIPDTLGFENPRFSPDGRRIAVSIATFNRKAIWVLDRGSGILSRLSEDDEGTTHDRPEWTPDGTRVMYRLNSPAGNAMVWRPADRSGREERISAPRVAVNELVMAPDGQTVIGRCSTGLASSQDLWWWTLADTIPRHFTEAPEFETGARFSPDGRWVAYTAETGGHRELYVSPFPGPGGRVQVSREGAGLPAWGPDGRTLYYPQGSRIVVSTLSFAPVVTVTDTHMLFEGDYAFGDALHAPFDVGPDGTILLVRPVRDARTVVIRNFAAEMRHQLARQGAR